MTQWICTECGTVKDLDIDGYLNIGHGCQVCVEVSTKHQNVELALSK